MKNRLDITGGAAFLSSAALLALAVASPAAAQTLPEQQQQPSPTDDESVTQENSETIVVTATKRPEVLLDVAQSVTVVGGDTLERQHATNFQDYTSLVPGLSITSSTPGVTRITLRGVNTGGVASTVAVYMDEVPFGSSTGLANGAILSGDFDPFDINRLEVLRGPQGTLYGASSLGGVIRYVTNPPRFDGVEMRAQAGLKSTKGSGDLGYSAAAILNVPLSPRAAIRVDGFYRKEQGYVDSIGNTSFPNLFTGLPIGNSLIASNINDMKTYGGRASVLVEPTDNLSIRLTAFAQNLNTSGSSVFEIDPLTFKPLYGGLVQSLFEREPSEIKYRVYSGTVGWGLGFADLLSSTSWSTFSQNFRTDVSFALGSLVNLLANLGPDVGLLGLPPAAIIADPAVTRPLGVVIDQVTSTDKFTQEVRLTSPDSDTFEWLLGLFYTNEDSAIDPQNVFATDLGTGRIAPDVEPLYLIFLRSAYEEYAGFANATWHATPQFEISLGGRWSRNKQNANEQITGPLTLGTDVIIPNVKSSESVFTYSVAPRYEINDHTSLYARVASGYRPGGPNVIAINSPPGTPATYGADRLTSWELGLKAEDPNNLWSFEAAAYHLGWKDIQLFAVVNDIGVNTNGGKARVNGLEVSGALRPTRGLTIAANGAYTDSKLNEDTPPITGGLKGDPLPYAPKWSGAIHADYEFPVASWTGFVGGSVAYVGKRGASLGERAPDGSVVKIPSYTEVNLRGGARFDRFTVEAFVRNLFNERGITSAVGFDGTTFPNGAAAAAIIRPRTIGVTITAGFRG